MRSARIWVIAQTETRKSVLDSSLLMKWTLTRWKRSWNEQRTEAMEKNLYNVGDTCKVTGSCYTDKLGKFVTIKETCKT